MTTSFFSPSFTSNLKLLLQSMHPDYPLDLETLEKMVDETNGGEQLL